MHRRLLAIVGVTAALLGGPVVAQDNSAAPPAPGAPATEQGTAPPTTSAPDADTGTGPTDDGATFQTFYDALSSQGTWIKSSDYAYVWQPSVTDPNWAPYTEGHWAYTEDGWTWVSDEPYGWAVYHYGRWVNLEGTGWVWVPGYTWAPAWVSWRYGDGYAGWAPLPPDSMMGIDYFGTGDDADGGYHIGGDVDDFYGIGAGCYIFLPVQYLGYRHYRGYYCDRHDNYGRINHTHNVTNINVSHRGGSVADAGGRTVTTGGPQFSAVDAVSVAPIERQHLVRTNQPGAASAPGTLAVYAPRISSGTNAAPPHVGSVVGSTHINHGTDIAAPLAVNAHLAPAAASPAQIAAAHAAAEQAPAMAKVVTAGTAVHATLPAPLATFRPVTSMPLRGAPAQASEAHAMYPGPGSAPMEHEAAAGGSGEAVEPHSAESYGEIYHAPVPGVYPGAAASSRPESGGEPGAREAGPPTIYPGPGGAIYYHAPMETSVPPMEVPHQPGAMSPPPVSPHPVISPGLPHGEPAGMAPHAGPVTSGGGSVHAVSGGGAAAAGGEGVGRGH